MIMCQWRHPLLLFLFHTACLVSLSSVSASTFGHQFSIFTSAAVTGDNEIIHDDLSSFFTYTGNWFTVSPGRSCAICVGNADPAKAHAASWSDGNAERGSGGSCKFFGRGIAIYGIHFRYQGSMTFQLDGNAPVTYNRAISEQIYEYDQEFFRADGLNDTVEHTLTFKVGVNSVNGEKAILLDYAKVLLPIEKNTVGSPVTTAAPNSGPSTGVIAGAVAGGVSAGILILALVLFLWKRRNRRGREWHGMESNPIVDNAAVPSNAAYIQSYHDENASSRTDTGSSSVGFTHESTIPGRILVVPSEKERRMWHQELPAAVSVNDTEVDEDPALLQQRIRELETELAHQQRIRELERELAAQRPPGYSG